MNAGVSSFDGSSGNLAAARRELAGPHTVLGVETMSAPVTVGVVASTAPHSVEQAVATTTLDELLSRTLVVAGLMRFAAPATEGRTLGNEVAADWPSTTDAALEQEGVGCCTPSGLHFKWHSIAFRTISLKAVLRSAPPALERAEVRRLRCILRLLDDSACRRLGEHLGEVAVWSAPSDMPGEGFFVFTPGEVRYYDPPARLLFRCSVEATDFASPAAAIEDFKMLPRNWLSARYQLTANNARRRFDRVFGIVDYRMLRQPETNIPQAASATLLHDWADL